MRRWVKSSFFAIDKIRDFFNERNDEENVEYFLIVGDQINVWTSLNRRRGEKVASKKSVFVYNLIDWSFFRRNDSNFLINFLSKLDSVLIWSKNQTENDDRNVEMVNEWNQVNRPNKQMKRVWWEERREKQPCSVVLVSFEKKFSSLAEKVNIDRIVHVFIDSSHNYLTHRQCQLILHHQQQQ